MDIHRRQWVPNPATIADQLVNDYRNAKTQAEDPREAMAYGDLDAIGTLASWLGAARDHFEEFQEDDWVALVQELARRAAGLDA
jgi:hypothetical protein